MAFRHPCYGPAPDEGRRCGAFYRPIRGLPLCVRRERQVLNLVVVIGSLGKPPLVRELPSGMVLGSFDVQVPRTDLGFDIVPIAIFDPPQEVCAFCAGQDVLAVGRVRRRFFRVGGSTQSRTEVVAERVVALTNSGYVAQALSETRQALAELAQALATPGP